MRLIIEGIFMAALIAGIVTAWDSLAKGWNKFCDMKDQERGEDQ